MLQKFPADGFKWVKNTSKFDKNSIKTTVMLVKYIFLVVDVHYPERLYDLHNDLPFFTWKNENWKSPYY